jgi:hypothetical protein
VKEQKLREKVTPADKKTLTFVAKRIDDSVYTNLYIVKRAQDGVER